MVVMKGTHQKPTWLARQSKICRLLVEVRPVWTERAVIAPIWNIEFIAAPATPDISGGQAWMIAGRAPKFEFSRCPHAQPGRIRGHSPLLIAAKIRRGPMEPMIKPGKFPRFTRQKRT